MASNHMCPMRSCSDHPLLNDVNEITNEIGAKRRRRRETTRKRERKNIHNLSWRASHFLQFNPCIMSMFVKKKIGTKYTKNAVPSPTRSIQNAVQSFRFFDAAAAATTTSPLMSSTNVGNNQRHSHICWLLEIYEDEKKHLPNAIKPKCYITSINKYFISNAKSHCTLFASKKN